MSTSTHGVVARQAPTERITDENWLVRLSAVQ